MGVHMNCWQEGKKGDLSQTMTRTWVFNTEILEMSCCRVGSPPRFKNSVKRSQSDTSCSYNTSCVSWYCETSAPSTPGEQEVHNLQTETAASHISDYISVYNLCGVSLQPQQQTEVQAQVNWITCNQVTCNQVTCRWTTTHSFSWFL